MLAPEVGSAKATLSAFATATKAVSGYCIDLTNANLGPFDIGGTQVNVLSNWPAVQTNIAAARRHATTFLDQNTMIMTLVGVLDFNSAFQKSSGEIVGALNGNGGQQQIAMALQSLLAALQTRAQAVLATETAMKTFNSQLTADESNLNSGEQPISQAIQDVNNWVITEGEAVEGGPGGAGMVSTIASVGSQLAAAMGDVLSAVQSLVQSNETAGPAVSALLVMWQTLADKYQGVIGQLAGAGGAGILEAGDIAAAQLAWNELATYAGELLA